ncbi:peptidylprolyl isomerase [Lichenicoccus roseus]|nr:peptidylprolyl isomerase [Lichenicoccus roseus]
MTRTGPLAIPALALLASMMPAAATLPCAAQTVHHHAHQPPAATTAANPTTAPDDGGQAQDAIVAVVNGNIITRRDVDNRGRLFALSTGLPMNDEVLARLRPQITRQLIDEKLRMQEIQSRHIVIAPEQIAAAIGDIEKRNNMKQNALRDHLEQDGVSLNTLIDQIRVQLGWTHVLREQLGERARIGNADIKQREAALKREVGQPEYNISEIFIPVDDPTHNQDALNFAQTVIKQLHDGAPFAIVAAQFSQAQTALEGGSLGWVQADELDPQVLDIVRQMPTGAVSNPIRVAGGYDVVTLLGKREIGREIATMMGLRQAFFPFTSTLNPQAPTPQQQQALARAEALSKNAHDCGAVEAANQSAGSPRPANPGDVQLDHLNPQMRAVLDPLKPGQATRPLVSTDGIAVIMVCSRDTRNLSDQSPDEIADQLLNERVEQVSRQVNRDLHRRASIEMRSS